MVDKRILCPFYLHIQQEEKMDQGKDEKLEKKEWSTPELTILDIESKTKLTGTGTGGDGISSYS